MAELRNIESYAQIKERLKEIAQAVENDELPLEEALDLYEEAVSLGSQVSSLIRSDIDAKLLALEPEIIGSEEEAADGGDSETLEAE